MIDFAHLISGVGTETEITGVSDYHCPICGRNMTKIFVYSESRIYIVCEKCRCIRAYRDKLRGME